MFKIITISALTAFMLSVFPVYAGTVQCQCPNIKAKGTGDTSCSATESGSNCTIDFNYFNPADEAAAYNALNQGNQDDLSWVGVDAPPLNFARSQNLDHITLVNTILIYTLISGVQHEDSIPIEDIFSIHSELINNSETVFGAFNNTGSSSDFSTSEMNAFILHGCIELVSRNSNYWGMFKTNWSENAPAKQCGR